MLYTRKHMYRHILLMFAHILLMLRSLLVIACAGHLCVSVYDIWHQILFFQILFLQIKYDLCYYMCGIEFYPLAFSYMIWVTIYVASNSILLHSQIWIVLLYTTCVASNSILLHYHICRMSCTETHLYTHHTCHLCSNDWSLLVIRVTVYGGKNKHTCIRIIYVDIAHIKGWLWLVGSLKL